MASKIPLLLLILPLSCSETPASKATGVRSPGGTAGELTLETATLAPEAGHLASPAVFDWNFYVQSHPDLAGFDETRARAHWLTHGISEGRKASPEFAVREYLERYPDLAPLAGRFAEAVRHYVQIGQLEGRQGSFLTDERVFDWVWYANAHADLRAAGLVTRAELTRHWVTTGFAEGRVGSPAFHAGDYVALNPDLAGFGGNLSEAVRHFVLVGHREQRRSLQRPLPAPRQPEIRAGAYGSAEVVFDWRKQRCGTAPGDLDDLPDSPARMFRRSDGALVFFASHWAASPMVGTGFSSLHKECRQAFRSDKDPSFAAFNDTEWLMSFYTHDGNTVWGLVHNEFHPWERGQCASADTFKCWFNAITAVRSTDGGATFGHGPAPSHLIARTEIDFADGLGPTGPMEPSNIIFNRNDRHYYFMTRYPKPAYTPGAQKHGTCLLRTQNPDDPGSWRAWDGSGFNADMHRQGSTCAVVSPEEIGSMNHSISWNSYYKKFLLVGVECGLAAAPGESTCGFFFSLSDDLVHWSPRKLILRAKQPHETQVPGDSLIYPSLIDPSDGTMAFQHTGKRAYLHFSAWNNRGDEQRENRIERLPIEFF